MAKGEETGFPAVRTHAGVTDSAKRQALRQGVSHAIVNRHPPETV